MQLVKEGLLKFKKNGNASTQQYSWISAKNIHEYVNNALFIFKSFIPT